MAGFRLNIFVATLVCCLIVACMLFTLTASDVRADTPATSIPQNNTTTPTSTPTPTPGPTPLPRQVFSDPRWDGDRVSILVTNNGAAVTVVAYLSDPMSNLTYTVDTGVTKRVQTPKATAASGMVDYSFNAYEHNSVIQIYEDSLPVSVSPTPPPESAVMSGIVLNAATNSPISGAVVNLTSDTFKKAYPPVYTDASGAFLTPSMYPDSYQVTIRAEGYQTLTINTARLTSGVQKLNDQKLSPISVSSPTVAPTPTPVPSVNPSPTPGSPVDAWVNLLSSPTVCVSTIAVLLGAGVSATALYEWTLRQRERRRKEAEKSEQEKRSGENKP
jgi:hypothetical protein